VKAKDTKKKVNPYLEGLEDSQVNNTNSRLDVSEWSIVRKRNDYGYKRVMVPDSEKSASKISLRDLVEEMTTNDGAK